jgi:hypothetical protein
MAIDIIRINSGEPINNNKAVCSTLPTGETAKLLVRYNYPVDLTIGNIESKYQDRFDDPTYYCGGISGDVDGGDVGSVVVGG